MEIKKAVNDNHNGDFPKSCIYLLILKVYLEHLLGFRFNSCIN